MKKIKFKTIVAVFACILGIQLWGLLYGLFLVGIIDHENSYLITYNDINLYAEDAYFNLSTDEDYLFVSKKCSEYLPKSEGFKYWDNIKGFYIHDGAKTLTLTAISFVLELQFENTKEYEDFLKEEHDRWSYTDKFNIQKNAYHCFITESQDITYDTNDNGLPLTFGMVCENKQDLVVRLIYYSDMEGLLKEDFEYFFKTTNCEW